MDILKRAQRKLYSAVEGYRELRALERLFSQSFLQSIANAEADAGGISANRDVAVELAWIDKIPLAKFVPAQSDLDGHAITSRVELGDLLVHRKDTIVTRNKTFVRDSRSAIIQAKIARDAAPQVPVGRLSPTGSTSTSKELKLLQDWPAFDLYETSRSADALLKNVRIGSSAAQAYFWAYLGPDRHWLSGSARLGAPCEETLDSFFAGMRAGTHGESVGSTNRPWSDLTWTVLAIAGARTLPPSLSSGQRSRIQRARYAHAGFTPCAVLSRRMAVLTIDVQLRD